MLSCSLKYVLEEHLTMIERLQIKDQLIKVAIAVANLWKKKCCVKYYYSVATDLALIARRALSVFRVKFNGAEFRRQVMDFLPRQSSNSENAWEILNTAEEIFLKYDKNRPSETLKLPTVLKKLTNASKQKLWHSKIK